MQTRFLISIALIAFAGSVWGAELPQYAEPKHMGVATCGNSVCHAVTDTDESGNVRQDEYPVWLFHDRHSQAYKTLLSPASQQIASKLGLASAETADICLDCHADNVAEHKRGPEFHISDGVGCEACHGGAENWLSRHTLQPYSQQRNLDDGMYPTAPLGPRATLCASCHVGNQDKLASHKIMGAGHPRLGFELDTLSIRQPEHYTVDEDYLSRKNPDNNRARLLIGTAIHAQVTAQNLMGELLNHPQGYPELTLFNCHSCHQSLDSHEWRKRPSTAGLEPGAIRVNDSSFLLLAALIGSVDAQLQTQLLSSIKQLHKASSQSTKAVQQAAATLHSLAESAHKNFAQTEVSAAQTERMIRDVMNMGIRGEYQDYMAAEQAVMAMDALSVSLPSDDRLKVLIDRAYQLTITDESYSPQRLRAALETYLAE